jgi:hypothetical protein
VGDQWAWRDLLADMSRVDERVTALLSLVVHPGSFTTLLRKIDREKVVAAFADRLPDLTGDLDRDLHAVVVALQAENGGHGVDLNAPPLVNAWSGSVDTGGAWLVRGQVDRRDRVPAWVSQNMVTLTVGRFRQMPADPTQATLTALVDELYSDQPVIKREGKKRDVLAFALGMRPGDLVATDDSGRLRLGRVQEGDAALDSIGGTTLLTRPVAWSSSNEMKITELPGTVRSRLRFKGEDIVNLTEILDELESLEAGASDVGGAAVAQPAQRQDLAAFEFAFDVGEAAAEADGDAGKARPTHPLALAEPLAREVLVDSGIAGGIAPWCLIRLGPVALHRLPARPAGGAGQWEGGWWHKVVGAARLWSR